MAFASFPRAPSGHAGKRVRARAPPASYSGLTYSRPGEDGCTDNVPALPAGEGSQQEDPSWGDRYPSVQGARPWLEESGLRSSPRARRMGSVRGGLDFSPRGAAGWGDARDRKWP
jgi:hypothetical protein